MPTYPASIPHPRSLLLLQPTSALPSFHKVSSNATPSLASTASLLLLFNAHWQLKTLLLIFLKEYVCQFSIPPATRINSIILHFLKFSTSPPRESDPLPHDFNANINLFVVNHLHRSGYKTPPTPNSASAPSRGRRRQHQPPCIMKLGAIYPGRKHISVEVTSAKMDINQTPAETTQTCIHSFTTGLPHYHHQLSYRSPLPLPLNSPSIRPSTCSISPHPIVSQSQIPYQRKSGPEPAYPYHSENKHSLKKRSHNQKDIRNAKKTLPMLNSS
ncbi:uncharacterized protein BDR25DRAFT_356548 [Lindgomyces ingoldianus]|uniref:Uncharacterized protein n=1 Tax=Lindgomyces ingoldianus TaxID=673940 RepID=A0ACB6QQV7_9PLEO|nr:uncharacterized protein BDR25DRAFT_356548 [Lindgomyces ingoldianus]KAF2469306.1 hypothetical protein BDR25DRAFT_356548 [Lindgomyces ingoldianus]